VQIVLLFDTHIIMSKDRKSAAALRYKSLLPPSSPPIVFFVFLQEALHSARREAAAAFGDDRVLLERFIQAPRHVEVQLMADGRGNAYYLAERDCSVQRRHQKVIEEAPAPGVSRQFRAALGKSAVDAARAVGYRNAGTVEFIVDSKTDEHYFMEMNTRLQVEHPVTEAVCGVDLVELQLRVAAGESLANLGLNQEDLEPQGHAVEARLYAENPANNFLPAGGKLLRWRMPPGSTSFAFSPTADSTGSGSANDNDNDIDQTNDDGAPRPSPSQHQQKSRAHAPVSVRIDSGVREGDLVGVHYDPMIAKVVVKAGDRPAALRALSDALGQLQASGVPTNAAFVRRVLGNEGFKTVAVDTSFISRHEEELLAPEPLRRDVAAFAAAMLLAGDGLAASAAAAAAAGTSEGSGGARGPWALADAFRVNHKHSQKVVMTHVGSGRCMDADVAWVGGSVNGFIVRCKDILGGGGGGGGDEGGSGEGAVTVRSLRFESKDRVVAVVDGRLLKAEKCSHV
jgi:3-methylcrotonyl-CoA carboxylase alpha subunit